MVELCVVFLLPRDGSHANADAVCVMMLALGVGFCVQMAVFIFVTWGVVAYVVVLLCQHHLFHYTFKTPKFYIYNHLPNQIRSS